MVIKSRRLIAKEFLRYGRVLTEYKGLPDADDDLITYWGDVGFAAFGGPVNSDLLLGHPRRMVTRKLEQHLKTHEGAEQSDLEIREMQEDIF